MPRLLGVVLCGGQSSRMGRDKGLISENGKTWAEQAHDLLATMCSPVVYSINPQQLSAYHAALPRGEFVVDTLANAGPLGGLLSVQRKYSGHNVLLLACDMIFVNAEDMRALTLHNVEIAAYRHAGIFEPLCAYYSATALDKMAVLFSEGKIPVGLQKILQLPALQVAALQPGNPGHLKSQNEPR